MYIQKRLASGSDVLKIAIATIVELPGHSPAEVALLQNGQPTSAAVERSFLILKKFLCFPSSFKLSVVSFTREDVYIGHTP